jgi:hypothetical protein
MKFDMINKLVSMFQFSLKSDNSNRRENLHAYQVYWVNVHLSEKCCEQKL